MNNMDLLNKNAIVTGGAQGIGGAVTKKLASNGARLAIWDLDFDLGTKKATALGNGSIAIKVDVSNWQSVQNAYAKTLSEFERVDILVHSAGIAGSNAPVVDYSVEEFKQIIEINLMGTFHVNKVVLEGMRSQNYGRIVNIASVAGKEGNPNAMPYSAAKAGVIALTKSLGKELSDKNISVNCVTPAAAKTKIFDQMSQEHIDYMLSKIPRGRFLKVDELASMVSWLVSEENSYTTGAVFDLSGGRATY